MGQIVSAAAKPKRCNANQLSQVPTPAAGEYILVSSDNSMNAAGQGNFDCYIVGDGTTAATALPLKNIADLEIQWTNNSVSNKAVYEALYGSYFETKKDYAATKNTNLNKTSQASSWQVDLESGKTYTFVAEGAEGIIDTDMNVALKNPDFQGQDSILLPLNTPTTHALTYNVRYIGVYVQGAHVKATGTITLKVYRKGKDGGIYEEIGKIQVLSDDLDTLSSAIQDKNVDLTKTEAGSIPNTGVWVEGGEHIMFFVYKGSVVNFTASSVAVGIYAELASDDQSVQPTFIIPRTAISRGTSVTIEIEQDGYFYVHAKTADNPTTYTPSSVSVVSPFSTMEQKIEAMNGNMGIMFAGSSSIQRMFTQTGQYSLGTLLDGYVLHNYGVGGENIRAICARITTEAIVVANGFTIPADTTPVSGLTFNVRGQSTAFTNQRGDDLPAINPVYIDGVEGNLTMNGSTFVFTRLQAGNAVEVSAGDLIIPQSAQFFGLPIVTALGYNGGYDSEDDYISYHDAVIRHYEGNYIFMGILVVGGAWDSPTEQQLSLENKMTLRFGANYFNIRYWLAKHGIEYGIKLGLLSSSTYPTQQDAADIAAGVVPTSLRSDTAHLTSIGYQILNYRLVELMKELSIVVSE